MIIRKAEEKDCETIADLLVTIGNLHHNGRPDIYPDAAKYSPEQVRELVKDESKIIFVAADEKTDSVNGYIICFALERKFNGSNGRQNTLYIDDLCVSENCRRQNIGKELLMKAKSYAEENGFYNVELNVWSFNESAVNFYESCGMTEQRKRMEFIIK